jgi:hypothetical protein
VAFEAARLMVSQDESEYFRAKIRAARRVCGAGFRPADLPTNREIRRQIHEFARGDRRQIDRASLGRLPERPAVSPLRADPGSGEDRFHVYHMLLLPLDKVSESRQTHPEGDVLYHSLQVFDLAREKLPYDEEFLLAALLHDVGKAIDPRDHVAAALEALAGFVTSRTAWFVEHHVEALSLAEGTLGVRSLHRLQAAEDFQELLLLARCDLHGRQVGIPVPDVEDSIEYLRDLSEMCGE